MTHYRATIPTPTFQDVMLVQAQYKECYGAIVAFKLAPLGGHSSSSAFGLRISVYTLYGTAMCDRYPGWYLFPSDHATTLAGFIYNMLLRIPEDVLEATAEVYRRETLEAQ